MLSKSQGATEQGRALSRAGELGLLEQQGKPLGVGSSHPAPHGPPKEPVELKMVPSRSATLLVDKQSKHYPCFVLALEARTAASASPRVLPLSRIMTRSARFCFMSASPVTKEVACPTRAK